MASTAAKKRAPIEAQDRRKQILRAAIDVFAERGFHKTRVSDIARRAGVAYGLIYHYFPSKDAVLHAVFEESWAIFLKVLQEIAADGHRSSVEKIGAIADLLIGALRMDPALIHVIIQEVSRSDRFGTPGKVEAFEQAFAIVRAIISAGQAAGEIRPELEPHAAAFLFFGALETLCTGSMIGKIRCRTDQEAERLKRVVRTAVLDGFKER
ncbi:MAG: TetR/AcrR family transcriptional regulator [Deltaproteobacteria bacterium]|nr:TetR/AcrR family transcriptional regulator [Deltaproteobacteria bacterium]